MLNKKIIVLIILSAVIVLIVTLICKNLIFSNNDEKTNIETNINIDIYEYIKNREFEIIDNVILIGKNKKEISNGYYDVKIEGENEYLNLYFNKLYKEEYVNKIYVDENYLYEIIEFINDKYNLKLQERIRQELVILIKDKYTDYRINNNEIKFEKNITQTYKCKINVDNNMLNVKIYKV